MAIPARQRSVQQLDYLGELRSVLGELLLNGIRLGLVQQLNYLGELLSVLGELFSALGQLRIVVGEFLIVESELLLNGLQSYSVIV